MSVPRKDNKVLTTVAKIVVIVIVSVVLFVGLVKLCVFVNDRIYKPTIICDPELYITDSFYVEESDDKQRHISSSKARMFFPKYDEIKDDVSSLDFTVAIYPDSWLPQHFYFLDTSYDTDSEYESVKQQLLNKHYSAINGEVFTYDQSMPWTTRIGKFDCYVAGDGDCSSYARFYGVYCFNDEDKVIRYLYYWHADSSVMHIEAVDFYSKNDWD